MSAESESEPQPDSTVEANDKTEANQNDAAKGSLPSNFAKNYSDLAKCPICLDTPKEPCLCHSCGKCFCQKCIQDWIANETSEATCPNCRAKTSSDRFYKPPWMSELLSSLESVVTAAASQNPVCSEHQEQLTCYCDNCDETICSKCALMQQNHSGHQVGLIKDIFNRRKLQLEDERQKTKRITDDLRTVLDTMHNNTVAIRSAKDVVAAQIDSTVDRMKNRLEDEMNAAIDNYLCMMGAPQQKLDFINDVLQVADSSIPCDQVNFLKGSTVIMLTLRQIQNSVERFNVDPPSVTFTNELVPGYSCGLFKVERFSHQWSDVISSAPSRLNGLEWRLNVHKKGRGAGAGRCLSVFLELCSGLREESDYDYRIEMIHRSTHDPTRSVFHESTAQFRNNESRGFEEFYTLNDLANNGYLGSNDCLEFKFQVRPLTYIQLCRDLKWQAEDFEHVRLYDSLTHYGLLMDDMQQRP